jgi:hypothetical protein
MPTAAARTLLICAWLGALAGYSEAGSSGVLVADPKSGCKVWNPHPLDGETASWSGGCANGFAQGAGTLQWLRGGKAIETDEGEWNLGLQSGRGTQEWNAGRYQGELLNGEPNGQGVLILQSGRYEGEFRSGKPNGEGTVTNFQGIFKGHWKDGCLKEEKRKISFGVPATTCP